MTRVAGDGVHDVHVQLPVGVVPGAADGGIIMTSDHVYDVRMTRVAGDGVHDVHVQLPVGVVPGAADGGI